MKPREARRKVMIKARMRAGAAWSDALILNLSSRGMLVRADQSLSRGSYLEIRRGPHVIVARVIWARSGRLGVQTQDPLPAEDLISDSSSAAAPARAANTGFQDRRAAPRRAEARHESSRRQARVAEFTAIVMLCGIFAAVIGGSVVEVVAKPLEQAKAALAPNQKG